MAVLGVLTMCLILVVSLVSISGCQKSKVVDNQAETIKDSQNGEEKDITQTEQQIENEVGFSTSEPDSIQSQELTLPLGESGNFSGSEEPLRPDNSENSEDSKQPESLEKLMMRRAGGLGIISI